MYKKSLLIYSRQQAFTKLRRSNPSISSMEGAAAGKVELALIYCNAMEINEILIGLLLVL